MLWEERYCRRGNDVLISWDQKFQQKTEKIVYTIYQNIQTDNTNIPESLKLNIMYKCACSQNDK